MLAGWKARHGGNSDGGVACRCRAAGGGAAHYWPGSHGGAYAAFQSEPSMDSTKDLGRRTQDSADGCADLFLSPLQLERSWAAPHLDRSSALASRLSYS